MAQRFIRPQKERKRTAAFATVLFLLGEHD